MPTYGPPRHIPDASHPSIDVGNRQPVLQLYHQHITHQSVNQAASTRVFVIGKQV